MNTWNQRLSDTCETKSINTTELSRACKVSVPTASGWLTGKIKTLEAPSLLKICNFLGIDPWWLVLGIDNGKAPITEGKSPLSSEARKLILWVERVDGLGDPAPKLFGHIYQLMQVAGTITHVQNSLQDAELARAAADLPSLIGQPGGKESASKKHQP